MACEAVARSGRDNSQGRIFTEQREGSFIDSAIAAAADDEVAAVFDSFLGKLSCLLRVSGAVKGYIVEFSVYSITQKVEEGSFRLFSPFGP